MERRQTQAVCPPGVKREGECRRVGDVRAGEGEGGKGTETPNKSEKWRNEGRRVGDTEGRREPLKAESPGMGICGVPEVGERLGL